MQNIEASVTSAGVPGVNGPAGFPVSLIERHSRVVPKQPKIFLLFPAPWSAQKLPSGVAGTAPSVVRSGERLTAIVPTGSSPRPVRGGQSRVWPAGFVLDACAIPREPGAAGSGPGLEAERLAASRAEVAR